MGMDIYGVNPKIKENTKTPERPENMFGEDKTKPQPNRKAIDKYFEEKSKFEEENQGCYFRNNVWWWRPLGNFIHDLIAKEDWATKKHLQALGDNSGFEWSEEEALIISNKLQEAVDNGTCKKLEKKWKKEALISDKHNKQMDKKMKLLEKKVKLKTGNKNIAPADYPAQFKKQWDFLWGSRDWTSSYPFAEKNVIEFIGFAKNSGGFKIC